jgi:hypothetical protein
MSPLRSLVGRVTTVLLAAMLVGCIREPTSNLMGAPAPGTPPPQPPPASEVQSCESTRTWHNIWVLSGTLFAGIGGAGGTVSAIDANDSHNVQVGLGIGIAAAAVLGGLATAAAGITADNYSTDNCPAILQQQAAATAAASFSAPHP